MYIERVSASAVGVYKFCPWQYFLQYVLGMESPSGKAALQGTIVHQVFEWMAKLAKKDKYIDPMWLLDYAWDMHTAIQPEIEIRRETSRGESADFKLCRVSIEKVLANPTFNPAKLKILDAERWFEIEMLGEEWEIETREGAKRPFRMRGFMDIVHEIDEDTIEIIDWKTGKRRDWRTMQEKDFYALMEDAQPRFYHFAASQLYPQYKNILVTFYYMNDGGPMTLPFSFEDIIPTVGYIWNFYSQVKRDGTMQRNTSWKCSKFCSYGRTQICESAWADLHARGQEYVEIRYQGLSVLDQKKITNLV